MSCQALGTKGGSWSWSSGVQIPSLSKLKFALHDEFKVNIKFGLEHQVTFLIASMTLQLAKFNTPVNLISSPISLIKLIRAVLAFIVGGVTPQQRYQH